jgi:hypothetical protein
MKRIIVLGLVLFTSLVSAAWAQQTTGKESAKHGKPVYYDTFDQKWLDPAKWMGNASCGGTLECVREIQNGHLRLERVAQSCFVTLRFVPCENESRRLQQQVSVTGSLDHLIIGGALCVNYSV